VIPITLHCDLRHEAVTDKIRQSRLGFCLFLLLAAFFVMLAELPDPAQVPPQFDFPKSGRYRSRYERCESDAPV
jgi:hypothetical protein